MFFSIMAKPSNDGINNPPIFTLKSVEPVYITNNINFCTRKEAMSILYLKYNNR
jgi:hypothetical protein